MRIQKRLRRTMLRCGLLLAAALAGCDGKGRGGGEGDEPADSAARITAASDTTTVCDPPPAVPPSYFTLASADSSWNRVTSFIVDSLIEFDSNNVGQGTVQICGSPNCKAVETRIQSVVGGQCLTDAMLNDGRLYMMALVTTADSDENTPVFGPGNQTNQVYLLVQNGQAHALYPKAGKKIAFVPNNPALQSGWSFDFCVEPHPDPDAPQAAWQPTSNPCPGPMAARSGAARGDTTPNDTTDLEPDPTELSYGWMACANGCCRFYGSPPGHTGNPGQTGPPPPGQTGPGGQPGQGNPNPEQGGGQPKQGGPPRR